MAASPTMTARHPVSELQRQLRQATRLAHHALDHHPILAPLLRTDLNVIQYGDALAALHGVYARTEAWVLDFLEHNPGLFDYRSRRKLPALESDLAALGRLPLRFCSEFSVPPGIGSLIGVLYTLEGSSQGGQFIANSLRQLDGAALPISFFTGYGDRSHACWEAFWQFAQNTCPASAYEAATATAVTLFGTIKDHLDSSLPST
jgi:heme oxygenase